MFTSANVCMFEGRLVKDPEFETVGKGKNAFTKARFSLAVERKLTKDQRDAKKNGEDVKSADFPRFVVLGGAADALQTCIDNGYLGKGKAMRVAATYEDFSWKDKNGDTQYGYDFKVEDWGFTVQDSKDNGNGNTKSNKPANKTNKKSNSKKNDEDDEDDNDTFDVDDSDIPF